MKNGNAPSHTRRRCLTPTASRCRAAAALLLNRVSHLLPLRRGRAERRSPAAPRRLLATTTLYRYGRGVTSHDERLKAKER